MTTITAEAKQADFAFRCRDLFHMNSLSGLKLLAGESSLGNIISRVNIMEVPDIENWAQANEFLVTTGYSHHHNMDAFLEIIPKLVERNVAALGIKPKRFIEDIPLQIIQCAEANGLPLFELPEQTIFSNVVREVMEQVISQETRNVLLLQNRLEQVSELMLHGGKMPQILEEIEAMIGNPLCILDAGGRLIASGLHEEFFQPVQRFMAGYDTNSSPRRTKLAMIHINHAGEELYLHVFNLWETEKDPILVVLAERNKPCAELDLSTVSRILPLINIRLSGENTYKLVKAKYFDDFLKDWLTGVIPGTEDLDIKGQLYGYDNLSGRSYRIAIVKFHSVPALVPDGAMLAELNRLAHNDALFTSIGGKLVVILPQLSGAHQELPDMQVLLQQIADGCATDHFTLCIGEAGGPLALREGYLDAENLHTASCVCNKNGKLITWEELGIYAVLSLLPKHVIVDKFLGRYIMPLVLYDKAHNSSLVRTLKVYFQAGCNIKLTAGGMYTHYNTVVYRLDKIKSLLGISFDDSEALLKLQLGVKIYEMGE
jgi:PucR family transcriptional regulator, purine catabolism regulatory protein